MNIISSLVVSVAKTIIRQKHLHTGLRYRIYYFVIKQNIDQNFKISTLGFNFSGNLNSYIDSHIYFWGYYEYQETHFVQKYLQSCKDPVCFDVGANCGYYTLLMATLSKHVYSFDPNTYIFEKLTNNVNNNTFKGITTVNAGLSTKKEEIPFYLPEGQNQGTGSFIQDYNSNLQKTPTLFKTINGDEFILEKNISKLDFIKMDVEGFELIVLQGLQHSIAQLKPVIMMEYKYDNEQYTIQDIDHLLGHEYDFYHLNLNSALIPMDKNDLSTLKKVPTIILWPKTKAIEFIK